MTRIHFCRGSIFPFVVIQTVLKTKQTNSHPSSAKVYLYILICLNGMVLKQRGKLHIYFIFTEETIPDVKLL